MAGKVTSDTRRLNQLINEADDRSQTFLNQVGFKVQQLAQMKSPLDTGANRNSAVTQTPQDPPRGTEEQIPTPPPQSVYVGFTMEYSIFLETGTHTMAARPYLIPAVREVENELEEFGRDIVR